MKKMRNFLTLAVAAALTGILLTGCSLQKQMKQLPQRLRLLHRQKLLPLPKKLLKMPLPAKLTQKLPTVLLLPVKRSPL